MLPSGRAPGARSIGVLNRGLQCVDPLRRSAKVFFSKIIAAVCKCLARLEPASYHSDQLWATGELSVIERVVRVLLSEIIVRNFVGGQAALVWLKVGINCAKPSVAAPYP